MGYILRKTLQRLWILMALDSAKTSDSKLQFALSLNTSQPQSGWRLAMLMGYKLWPNLHSIAISAQNIFVLSPATFKYTHNVATKRCKKYLSWKEFKKFQYVLPSIKFVSQVCITSILCNFKVNLWRRESRSPAPWVQGFCAASPGPMWRRESRSLGTKIKPKIF